MKKAILFLIVMSLCFSCVIRRPEGNRSNTSTINNSNINPTKNINVSTEPDTGTFKAIAFQQSNLNFSPDSLINEQSDATKVKKMNNVKDIYSDITTCENCTIQKYLPGITNDKTLPGSLNKKYPFVYSIKSKGETLEDGCLIKKYQFDCRSSSFMNADYENQGQYIYPGAIYNVNDFQRGKYNEIALHRSPITLSTDNPNIKSSSFVEINKPTIVTIREGVKDLFQGFDEERSGNMNFRAQVIESNNVYEQQLKILTGGGGSYGIYSGELESTLETKSHSEHHYLTVDIIKDLYTINSIPHTNYMDSLAQNKSNLVVINSVTYGVRLLANIDITGQEDKLQATLNTSGSAGFSVFSAHGHFDLSLITDNLKSDTKINCYVIGGPINSTVSFTLKDFKEQISKIISGATYNNARPIQYTLSDLKGNVLSIQSSVTDITETTCKKKFRLASADLLISTGDDDKDPETDVTFALYNDVNNIHLDRVLKMNTSCFPSNYTEDKEFHTSANANKFDEIGDLVGVACSCFNQRLKGNQLSSFTFHLFEDKREQMDVLYDGGYVIIKHDQHDGEWKINTVTLTLHFANGSKKSIVWNLSRLTIRPNSLVPLKFTKEFIATYP